MKNANTDFRLIDIQDDFIVVHKSANVNFHDEDDLGQGLFNQVKKQLACPNLYPVHRLDKMTSGLVIFAKTLACAQEFQQLFSLHLIEKYYLAISDKKPKKKQGLIKGDMEKSRRGSWKLLRSMKNPAISQFFSYTLPHAANTADTGKSTQGHRLYLIKPHSGKTHQIRVALSSIGAPIIGDAYYYPDQKSTDIDRGYLHAYAIKFQLNQKSYQYICQPDEGTLFTAAESTELIETLNSPWLLSWPKI